MLHGIFLIFGKSFKRSGDTLKLLASAAKHLSNAEDLDEVLTYFLLVPFPDIGTKSKQNNLT